MHGRRGLRMWVVSLLARSPKNGAEMMDAIEEMTQGWWRPSPGSMYPLLNELQREGMIQKRDDGRYEITKSTRDELEGMPGMGRGRPHGIADMLNEIEGYVSYFEDVDKSDPSKLQPLREGVKRIAERLVRLSEGGKKS
ncbi:MAG TPA: PadR family transcriptional regulator [Thermoplasmata archaeon]|nr:PadR family transcriptional regulator [Thermoplasmata archaeon]